MDNIKKKARGCLMGLILGDALGMFAENKTRKEIADMGITKIDKFYPQELNPFTGKRSKMSVGDWTDDTQLTIALMDALIETRGRFDMDVIAKKFTECYPNRIGWGKATRNACKRIIDGVSWKDSGDVNGYGNGIMMKIAPLVLVQALRKEPTPIFIEKCLQFGRMTHLSTPALIAGVVHAYLIFRLSLVCGYCGSFDRVELLGELYQLAFKIEGSLPPFSEKVSDKLKELVHFFSDEYVGFPFGVVDVQKEISCRYNRTVAESFSSWNSVGLSYFIFFNDPRSFGGVSEAVLAGGDTDTNASLVGSLLGALNGDSIIPTDLFIQVKDSEKILKKIDEFCDVCLK